MPLNHDPLDGNFLYVFSYSNPLIGSVFSGT